MEDRSGFQPEPHPCRGCVLALTLSARTRAPAGRRGDRAGPDEARLLERAAGVAPAVSSLARRRRSCWTTRARETARFSKSTASLAGCPGLDPGSPRLQRGAFPLSQQPWVQARIRTAPPRSQRGMLPLHQPAHGRDGGIRTRVFLPPAQAGISGSPASRQAFLFTNDSGDSRPESPLVRGAIQSRAGGPWPMPAACPSAV